MTERELILRIKAASNAAGFDKVKMHLSSIGDIATKATKIVAAGMIAGGVAVTGLGVAAVNSAADFQTQMKQVETLGADFGRPFREVEADVSALATRMGVDATDAATTLYNAVSAGVPPGNALEFMEAASKAAVGGAADLSAVGSTMSVVMNSWGESAGSATDITDGLFATIAQGVTTMPELASSMGNISGIAATLGVPFQDASAALAQVTTKGKTTAEASTMLKAAMSELMKPGKDLQSALEGIGFSSGQAAIESLGFQGTMEALAGQAASTGQAANTLFGSVEAGGAILAVTGDNADGARAKLEALANAQGMTQAALDKVNEGFERQKELLMSQLSGALREVGIALLPVVTEGMVNLRGALEPVIGFVTALAADFSSVFGPSLQEGAAAAHAVGNGLGIMSDDLVPAAENVSGFRDKFVELKDKFLEAQSAFQEGGIVGALEEITGFDIQALIDTVVDAKDAGIEFYNDALVPLADFVVGTVVPAIADLSKFLLENRDTVLDVAIAMGIMMAGFKIGQTVNAAILMFQAYKKAMEGATLATKAMGLATKLALGPVGWVILAISAAVALFAVAWKNNWGDIRGKTEAFVEWFKGIPAWMEETWNKLKAGVADLWTSWSEKWDNTIKPGLEKWGVILLGIVAPWTLLFTDSGRDIIQGFLDGMTNAWGAVTAWVDDKMAGLKRRWDNFWESKSPSRVMRRRGYWLMEGAALGIQDGGATAIEALQTVMAQLRDATTGPAITEARANLDAITQRIEDQWAAIARAGGGDAELFSDLNIDVESVDEFMAMLGALVDEGRFDRARDLWRRYYDEIRERSAEAHQANIDRIEDEIDWLKRKQEARREGQAGANEDGEVIEIKNLSDEIARAVELASALFEEIDGTKGSLEEWYSVQTDGARTSIERSEHLLEVYELIAQALRERADMDDAAYADQLAFIDILIADRAVAEEELNDLIALREQLYRAAADAIKEVQRAQEEGERRIHDGVMAYLDARREREEEMHAMRMADLDERMRLEDAAHRANLAIIDDEIAAIEGRWEAQEQHIEDMEDDLDILTLDLGIDEQLDKIAALEDELERLRVVADSFVLSLTGREHLDEMRRVQTERVRATTEEQKALIQSALDSGNLDEHLTRQAQLAIHGYKIRKTDMDAITSGYIDSVEAQLGAERTELALRQSILQTRRDEIEAAELKLAKDQQANRENLRALQDRRKAEEDRHADAVANIEGQIEAEKQRHKIEIDRFDYLEELEKQRHNQAMENIAAEAAFQLAMLGHSKEEINLMIVAAMKEAERIREATREIIADLERVAPVVGGGSSIGPQQPPQLPPGVQPPPQPPFPQPPGINADAMHVETSGPDAVVFEDGATISEGTIEFVELGGVHIEGTTVVVRLDGRDFAAQVVEEIEGDAELTDKLGRRLNERAARTTP